MFRHQMCHPQGACFVTLLNYISTIAAELLWNNHLTYGRTEQHTVFTYQTSNTQFTDAPEDGPVGPKHVELSNIL